MAISLTVFDGWNLDVSNKDEPLARDVEIAERFGFRKPRNIRQKILANMAELEDHGKVIMRPESMLIDKNSGLDGVGVETRMVDEYWLNEAQCLALVAFIKTPLAREVRGAMIKLFMAYRRGLLVPVAPVVTTTSQLQLDLSVAQGIRIGDDPRLRADLAALCGMTGRATGRSLQAIYGFVRKTYRVGSPFDVAALAWPIVKGTLEAIALGKLVVAWRLPTTLRLTSPKQVPFNFGSN